MEGKEKHTILFVDDESNILSSLVRLFRKEGYNIQTATSGRDGLACFDNNEISLVVSDNRMPEMGGVEFLSRVKEISPETVRIMLTGYADMNAVMGAINSGEVARYITKPWNDNDIKLIVRDGLDRYDLVKKNRELFELTEKQNEQLASWNKGLEAKVRHRTREIRDNFFGFVGMFADLMMIYDPYIGGHSRRVAALASGLAKHMGLEKRDLVIIESAALLHNIGLIGIPRKIVEKAEGGHLSESEKEFFKECPVVTQGLISSIGILGQAGLIIRSHQERFNGTGYPDGLKGEEIHIGARILCVCKVYDRLMHRKRLSLSKGASIEHLMNMVGKDFDPEVVNSLAGFINLQNEVELVDEKNPAYFSSLAELKADMVLAEAIRTKSGKLLLTEGTRLTAMLIEKVRSIKLIEPLVEPVSIVPDI